MTATQTPAPPAGRTCIRLSRRRLCVARYDEAAPEAFAYSAYRLNPQMSLAANLRKAGRTEELVKAAAGDSVQVLVDTPAVYVPLAEFQEEDCETLYDHCIPQEERRRVFYDIAPAVNCVVLFSLAENVCRTIEENFRRVNYISVVTPLLRHFAAKGLGAAGGKRCFVHTHGQAADVMFFEDSRLLMANTFKAQTATDVAYYALAAAQQNGAAIAPKPAAEGSEADALPPDAAGFTPFYVAGAADEQRHVADELRKYAANVRPISPTAEYNRHPVAATAEMPYDMVTLLLDA